MLLSLVTCVSPVHGADTHTVTLAQHISSDYTSILCIAAVCAVFGLMTSCLANIRPDARTPNTTLATPTTKAALQYFAAAAPRLMSVITPTSLGCILTVGTLSIATLHSAAHHARVNTLPVFESPMLAVVITVVALGYSLLLYTFVSGTPSHVVCHALGSVIAGIASNIMHAVPGSACRPVRRAAHV